MNIKLIAGRRQILVNNELVEIDVAPIQMNDRTLVPLRFIAEQLGYNVDWNDETEVVTIFDRKTHFNNLDDCAIDFYMHFNAMSIGMFREMGATIKKDNEGYYWTGVCIGNQDDVPEYKFDLDSAVAILHTHGGSGGSKNSISPKDRALSKKYNIPIYMCSPVGQCWKYIPDSKSIMFYDGAPVDLRCIKHLEKEGYKNLEKNIERFNEYFPMYHDLTDQVYGHTADYYNKMFAKGEIYVQRIDGNY